jgi:hypothetical protein
LLRRRIFEQRLQLLAHSSLLGGRGFRAATQQHGRNGKVLGCPLKKWWCVGVRVDICDTIGASVVVGLRPACRRRGCADVRLVRSWTSVVPVAIPLVGFPSHRNIMSWASYTTHQDDGTVTLFPGQSPYFLVYSSKAIPPADVM